MSKINSAPKRLWEQISASDPAQSVFVAASAGTGKTTILVDRVLRLLLGSDDQPGARPEKILCITYTKAAAAEMKERVQNKLGAWATMREEDLQAALDQLIDSRASPRLLRRACALFGDVLESPGPRIQTIHAFCQSVLARFPLEAGVPPHFSALEERDATSLATEIIDEELSGNSHEAAFLVQSLTRASCIGAIREILGKNTVALDGDRLRDLLKMTQDTLDFDLQEFCADHAFDCNGLRRAARILEKGSIKDREKAQIILPWLACDMPARFLRFDDYKKAFLTNAGTIRKTLAAKESLKTDPGILEILQLEAQRIESLCQILKQQKAWRLTKTLWRVAEKIRLRYAAEKRRLAKLDFNDLIVLTRNLLLREGAAGWVLYKLDGGIDHILIDEAQDTSRLQWDIVRAIADEFFAGMGRGDTVRTLFAVGDGKQSIFSFQGADPAAFQDYENYFAAKINAADQRFERVPLHVSFRSAAPVLQLVDSVFSDPDVHRGVSDEFVHHEVSRIGMAGVAELWPLVDHDDREESVAAWELTEHKDVSPITQLASMIAAQIEDWLKNGEMLPARNRAIQPGDILILVRRRNAFVNAMIRALKQRNIGVAGADRLRLLDHIAVQDLCALIQFLLLPEDDLTLAIVLKSPLLGWDDEALFKLARPRGGTLWQALQQAGDEVSLRAVPYLSHLLSLADWQSPYDLITRVLLLPCPADEVSGRRAFQKRLGTDALDPLDELLGVLHDYEIDRSDGLQGALSYLQNADPEIKRESEAGLSPVVRIMTVHGAKGLQAPIVFLPDTTAPPAARHANDAPLFWQDGMPVYRAPKDDRPQVLEIVAAQQKMQAEEEYKRLLYVALTRAEDRLYVCGWVPKKKSKKQKENDVAVEGRIDPSCWYSLVRQGFEILSSVAVFDDGRQHLKEKQTALPEEGRQGAGKIIMPPLPDFAHHSAPKENRAADIVAPSRIMPLAEEPEPSLLSPPSRYWRGTIIHKLLQILPDIAPEARRAIAGNAIRALTDDLQAEEQDQLIRSALRVIEDPEFAFLFEAPSLPEISLMASVDGTIIAGQVDRLRVTEKEVFIVDYKTDRRPPSDPALIPPAYLRQLASYKSAIRKIYPGKTIHCLLLWTEAPSLMAVEDDILG